MIRVGYFKRGLNYFFILCLILGIVILAVPNILEFVIAIFLIVLGISGLLSGLHKRRSFF
ncbi:MAG: DUF3096 domain-containing protein [Nanoarchaeota archaeon]|nr:DUF3096 domain-containing protein [DPANN group archaeon]MBL7116476.1 DUF3096 domain-containing protein [Nanoarchaeota archaeon]